MNSLTGIINMLNTEEGEMPLGMHKTDPAMLELSDEEYWVEEFRRRGQTIEYDVGANGMINVTKITDITDDT